MGGRRSRHWCGPGSFRETKKAVPPDRNQAGGALQLFLFTVSRRRDFKSRLRKGLKTTDNRTPKIRMKLLESLAHGLDETDDPRLHDVGVVVHPAEFTSGSISI